MRSSLIVNNSTYYNEQSIAKGDLAIVKYFTKNEEPFSSFFVNDNKTVVYRPIGSVSADVINCTVMDTRADNSYKLNFREIHVNLNNKEFQEYDHIYTECVLNNNLNYFSLVLDNSIRIKNDIGKTCEFIVSNSYSIDKTDSFEFEHKLQGVELDVFNNNKIHEIRTKSHNCYITKQVKPLDNKILYFNEIQKNIHMTKEIYMNVLPVESYIIDSRNKSDEEWESLPSSEVNVINKEVSNPIDMGSNYGGDLKLLHFTIQQMSFFEFKLTFEDKFVKDVFNLPLGLVFDKDEQRIIGTPLKSGKFTFDIMFSNDTLLNGIIDVPKLKRDL